MALILIDIENFHQISIDFGYQNAEDFILFAFSKIEVL